MSRDAQSGWESIADIVETLETARSSDVSIPLEKNLKLPAVKNQMVRQCQPTPRICTNIRTNIHPHT